MSDHPFSILDNQSRPPQLGEEISEIPSKKLQEKIESLIHSGDVVLFMKGTPDSPQCGFSANAVGILNQLGKTFKTFDILTNQEVRQGVKEYSRWPTYPQLYVQGKLIGGNDILMEMYKEGELQKLFAQL